MGMGLEAKGMGLGAMGLEVMGLRLGGSGWVRRIQGRRAIAMTERKCLPKQAAVSAVI